MNWFKKIFNKNNNEDDNCKKVIRKFGFKQNLWSGAYHKDYGTFDCLIWILNDRVKLKVYAKGHSYSETEFIGPPLPNKEELIAFIKSNT